MRRMVLGVLVPAAMVVAGCGQESGGDDQHAAAEECAHDTHTMIPAMRAAVSEDATVRVTMDMTVQGQKITSGALVALAPDGGEIDMTYRSPDEEMALIVMDDRVFLSESVGEPDYKEVDVSHPSYTALRSTADGMDITSEFAAWEAGLDEVDVVGAEEIEGEPVCHYALTINTADAAEVEGEPLPPGSPTTVTYQVYLDAQDLIRRTTFELRGIEAEMNAFDWNEPIEIEAPIQH